MKINGSLKFDASGLSQIENLRIEKVTTGAFPTWTSNDVGRLVYNTTSQVMWLGGASSWIALATGGNAAALQAEVDALEAALGTAINTDGTFNASALTGNLASATSVTNLFTKLQVLVATAQSAAAAEATRALAAEAVLLADLTAEVTRATGAEGTLTTNLAAEVTRATGAEGVLTTNLASEVTRATGAEGVITTNLTAEVTRATGRETVLKGEIDTEKARAIAAEVVLQTAITAEASTARAAELVIRDNLTAEVTARTNGDTTNATAIASEVTRATTAEGVLTTNLAAEVTRASLAENAINAALQAGLQGLTWKNPARVATTGNINLASAAAGYDGVTLQNGDRILVRAQTAQAENGIYVFNGVGTALTRSVDMDIPAEFNAATVYVREGGTQADLGYTNTSEVTTVGTTPVVFVQFNGAGSVTAGAGMTQSGNVLNVIAADGSITVTADAIQVSATLQNAVSTNTTGLAAEVTRATAAEVVLQGNITTAASDAAAANAAEVAARIADVNFEEARAIAAEGVLQTNINAEATRATAAEGVIAGNLTAEITARTSGQAANAAATTAEATRATAAEGVLTTNLASEVTRAEGAETALATRTTAAELKLSKIYYLYQINNSTPAAAAAVHTVNHNLGQAYCNVTVVDDTNNVVIPESIVFNTANQLTVSFNSAIACRVVVMGLA